MAESVEQTDIKHVAKMLRDKGYSYDQSKYLIAEARKQIGLRPPIRRKGSVDRLKKDELEALLEAAYANRGSHGLMIRTLPETGCRVSAFCAIRAEDVSFAEREIRIFGKGGKYRDIPILKSLAQELLVYLERRRTGYLFPSPRGHAYSSRRIQQILKELAIEADLEKRVYPHLLRHTIAQYLADRGMPENLLQKFLGHASPRTTQIYYEPSRMLVKQAFEEAMKKNPLM